MGQISQSGSINTYTGGVGQGIFDVLAGEPIAKGDLVEFGYNGKAYKVDVTDNAAVANITYATANSGQIVPLTSIVNVRANNDRRQAVLQGDDGSIFTLTCQASTQGVLLSKYSSKGDLLGSSVVVSDSNAYETFQLLRLSNGNIAWLACRSNAPVSFGVVSQSLISIKPHTGASTENAHIRFIAVQIASGGFAIIYQQLSSLLLRMATFDNVGGAVLSPVTIWTATGTENQMWINAVQLSSSDIAVALHAQNTGGSIGLFRGVFTTSGAVVSSMTNIDATNVGTLVPEMSVLNGYFAVSKANSANMMAFVFNNSGVQQGSSFIAPETLTNVLRSKIVNDGKDAFYLVWYRSTDMFGVITKLPITGSGYTTVIVPSNTSLNFPMDAFYENGLIVWAHIDQTTSFRFLVFNLLTSSLLSLATQNTIGGNYGGQYPRIIPAGDSSFIAMYDATTNAGTYLYVGKYANTSVIGVAQAAAAADSLVPVASPAGGYATNYIKGTVSKAFDHSAANIIGNKGAIMNYGAVLKGI